MELFRSADEDYSLKGMHFPEGVVVQWCNPLTLKSEQSGGMVQAPVGPHHLSVMTSGRGLD